QARHELDPHAGQVGHGVREQVAALGGGEQGVLAVAGADGDDHLVGEGARAAHEIEVAEGHRVERTRADGDAVGHATTVPSRPRVYRAPTRGPATHRYRGLLPPVSPRP